MSIINYRSQCDAALDWAKTGFSRQAFSRRHPAEPTAQWRILRMMSGASP